ncbi:MAG: alpha/beta fold hydrolase BchO [Pseudomonadota bacterium]
MPTTFSRMPDWESDGAAWPLRDKSAFIDVGDYRWHVQRMGAGPRVLLIHGTGAATHSWAGLAPILARSFEVCAFDLPGHGFTQANRWSPPTISHIAQSVAALSARLAFAPAIVVGHSAGAAIAVRMLTDDLLPAKALVSLNGALAPFSGPAGIMFPVMARMLFYNPFAAFAFSQGARDKRRVRRLIEQTGSTPQPEMVDAYAQLMKRPGHISGALGMMAHWNLAEMDRLIAALKVPSIFVAGMKDEAVPPKVARAAAERAAHGAFRPLATLGHLAHEEAPAAVADIISDTAAKLDL